MTVTEQENNTNLPTSQPNSEEQSNQTSPQENITVSTPDNEDVAERNWKAFREARKKERAEKEAIERRLAEQAARAAEKEAEAAALKAAMEAAFNKSSGNHMSYPDEETDDERIEKRVHAILAAREAEEEKKRAQREAQEYPQRLQSTYNDFSEVVNTENLDYLEYHYPEVAGPLKRLNDGYEKWSDIYRAVKKFVPNHASSKKDAVRAEQNSNKPKSISSPGLSQTQAGLGPTHLTDEKKAANWQRMQRALKGIG